MTDKQRILVAVDVEKTGSFLIQNKINSIGFYIGDEHGNELEKKKFNMEVRWPFWVTMKSNTSNTGNINNTSDTKEIKEIKEIPVTTVDYGDFEPKCWNEFWSKLDSAITNRCLENPTPLSQEEGWKTVAKFIDNLEVQYPDSKYKIKFLTDNASFDVAAIDYALEKYTGRSPMRYSTKGKYRGVVSADDMLNMLPDDLKKQADEYINSQVQHDHDPVNDAHHIYLEYIQAMKYKSK